jgi:hypothetical protein
MSQPDDLEPADDGEVTVVFEDGQWTYAPGQLCPPGFVPDYPVGGDPQNGDTALVPCVEEP